MAVNDVYRLVCTWRNAIDAPVCVNNFYFLQGNSLVLDTPQEDLTEAFIEKVVPVYVGIVTNQLTLSKISVSQTPLFETFYELDGLTHQGTASGDPLPPRTSALIRQRTATFTRRGRGRWFMPPAVEASSNGATMTSTHLTATNNFCTAVLTTMASGGVEYANWILQMWSKADQVARPITELIPVTRWSSQSDRKKLY